MQLGRAELVLEHRRGSFALLWSDGREARRYVLGLGADAELAVALRAPKVPVEVVPREAITVLSGARLRGYVTIPLVPTVVFRTGGGRYQPLLELHPPALRGQWDEQRGHTMRCASGWLWRFPFQTGEPHAVVPLRLENVGDVPACPGTLTIGFGDDDLHALRGALVLRPRRIRLRGDQEDAS